MSDSVRVPVDDRDGFQGGKMACPQEKGLEVSEFLWESGIAAVRQIGRVYINSQTRYIFRTIRGPERSL